MSAAEILNELPKLTEAERRLVFGKLLELEDPPLSEADVRRVEGLFALADQLEVRLAKARGQVDQLTPSLLARAWTHSLPARLGCALSLCEILFTRSQRVQIAGKLVHQDPTDEPAEELLERIKTNHEFKSHRDARK